MPLRTMLTQHILDKPLTPYAILHQPISFLHQMFLWRAQPHMKKTGVVEKRPPRMPWPWVQSSWRRHCGLWACAIRWLRMPSMGASRHMHTEECTRRCMIKRWQRSMCINVPLQGLQPALRHIERFSASSFSSSCRVAKHEPTPASLGLEGRPTPGAHTPSPFRKRSSLATGWRFPHRICE